MDELREFDDSLLLNCLMENMADSIYFKDRYCRLIWVSRKMAIDLGFREPSELLGKTDCELFGEEFGQKTMVDDLHVMETGQPIIGMVEDRELPGGGINWTSTTKLPIRDPSGKVIGLLGITREINELKKAEQDLQHLATHDILTSLPNRYLLLDRMKQSIQRANRDASLFAVLYVDLDGFKTINDRYGHQIGDQALKEIAIRLDANIRRSDTVARMGGDEFVVLLDGINQPENAMMVAQKLRAVLREEFEFDETIERVTASIGISLYPANGVRASDLLNAADHAMYSAKQKRDNCAFFSQPQMPN
jgi:diguanylate cyclase (GGDEF)-like protein/PAS domain S-box-containing protein